MEQEPIETRGGIVGFIRRKPLIIGLLVLIVILAIVLVTILRNRPQNYITVSGIIEATDVYLSSKVNARVERVYASEGDNVKKGQLLVRLRSDEFQDEVNQAKAAVEAAQARLNEALAGTRPEEIQRVRAQVEQARASVAGARQSLRIAEQAFTDSRELQARLENAETNYRASVAAYRQAQEALALLRQGTRTEQIQQAQAAVNQAEALARNSQEDYRRAQELYNRGAIPASQLDAARAAAESANAQLQQARARLQELQAGSRPEEIRRAEAAVQQAQAVMNGAQKALQTARQQYQERTQERQQLTAARTQYETAQAQLQAAEAHLRDLQAGARPEQIAQLRAQVNQVKAALSQAKTQFSNTTVVSPINGIIITRSVEPGELATVGSALMEIADLTNVKLKVYVEELVYGRIRLGQPSLITVDSYPGEVFRGKVTSIASEAEFTPREIQTREQRAKLVFAVEITVPNPKGELKPGMPADAQLRLYPPR